jgi:hypothetical protein
MKLEQEALGLSRQYSPETAANILRQQARHRQWRRQSRHHQKVTRFKQVTRVSFRKFAITIFSFKKLNCAHEAEWTLFQDHYFSENLVEPGIEPGTSELAARNSDH